MANDIVERLRDGAHEILIGHDIEVVPATTLLEAAEEIELWRNIAKMFYDQHENRRSCSLLASCKRCDAYEKAVRGE